MVHTGFCFIITICFCSRNPGTKNSGLYLKAQLMYGSIHMNLQKCSLFTYIYERLVIATIISIAIKIAIIADHINMISKKIHSSKVKKKLKILYGM